MLKVARINWMQGHEKSRRDTHFCINLPLVIRFQKSKGHAAHFGFSQLGRQNIKLKQETKAGMVIRAISVSNLSFV